MATAQGIDAEVEVEGAETILTKLEISPHGELSNRAVRRVSGRALAMVFVVVGALSLLVVGAINPDALSFDFTSGSTEGSPQVNSTGTTSTQSPLSKPSDEPTYRPTAEPIGGSTNAPHGRTKAPHGHHTKAPHGQHTKAPHGHHTKAPHGHHTKAPQPSSTSSPNGPPDCPGTEQPLKREFDVMLRQQFDILRLYGWAKEQLVDWTINPYTTATTLKIVAGGDSAARLDRLQEKITAYTNNSVNASDPINRVLGLDGISSCTEVIQVTLELPQDVTHFCFDSECQVTLCPVSFGFSPLSFIPSNNALLFGTSTTCELIKPALWDEWIELHFPGQNGTVRTGFFADPDADGLSNIIEYYGLDLVSIYRAGENRTQEPATASRRLQSGDFPPTSMNPLSRDTDSDLYPDPFEWQFGQDPTKPNSVTEDPDNDGVESFEEMQRGINPFKSDTDGDLRSDRREIVDGTPPGDNSPAKPDTKRIEIELTIGDPSGSHSERYAMRFGDLVHAARTFGVVERTKYNFTRGEYDVTIEHQGSRFSTPDYDYEARITPSASKELEVSVDDPGILGRFFDNSFDRTIGKVIKVKIQCKNEVENDECKECLDTESCTKCNEREDCVWIEGPKRPSASLGGIPRRTGVCTDKKFLEAVPFFAQDMFENVCACEICKEWAKKELDEIQADDWIDTLPRCPCNVGFRQDKGILPPPRTGTEAAEWTDDAACTAGKGCEAHPGAFGCIRSDVPAGYGQQCCYTAGGQNIASGLLGAGTPDKSGVAGVEKTLGDIVGNAGRLLDHYTEDYKTALRCCIDCEVEPSVSDSCDRYKGSDPRADGRAPSGSETADPSLPQKTRGARSDPRGCI